MIAWSVPDSQEDKVIQMMVDAGVQFVRMDFSWDWIENRDNQFSFGEFDRIVTKLHNNSIEVLPILGYSAKWASSSSGPNYEDWYFHPPKDPNDFADFVSHVVERYDGDGYQDAPSSPRIRRYEIWNEENWHLFWRPNPDYSRYVQLLQAAYLAAKEADPSCQIILGGLAGNGVYMGWEPPESQHALQKIYDAGGQGLF